MAARSRSNPLALAVLALLWERPMHPYEMSMTLRERRKDESVKLNFGSLYSVVDSLVKHGLIEAASTGGDRSHRLADRPGPYARQGVPPVRGGAVVPAPARTRRRGPAAAAAASHSR